jgi:fucose permease
MIATFAALALLYVGEEKTALYVGITAIGFFCANIFSIIFAFAIGHRPERTDEISGLMIMGVAGGAIFPVLMDLAAKGKELTPAIPATAISPEIAATYAWAPAGAILVLALCTAYLFFVSIIAKEKAA